MKSFYSLSMKGLAIIFVLTLAKITDAGTRYKDIVFSSYTVKDSIQFGSNLNIDGSNDTLLMDIYQPPVTLSNHDLWSSASMAEASSAA